MSTTNSLQSVDKKIAQEMVNAYCKEASKDPNSFTKAVWFPAEQILALANIINDGKHNGLRIYFAQYTEATVDGLPKDDIGRNTVLLVPTFSEGQTNALGLTAVESEDDTDNIENRGKKCPDMCEGVTL
ncbi:hypothetical protein [Pedobacter sandarakinus]|uniref:hypothetical protein n=1 Tax=Pedobacter sandarakinus TaxID=353156 RepID=UPI0022477B21|nr:hypothetical protein [Pedobacter sandarakinus]MCX2573409.1 hypothetical protein [Pedobacter sandarakinus]